MELTVGERILLFGLLPTEGNVTNLRMIRKLREDLSLTDDETKEAKVHERRDGDKVGIEWDTSAGVVKDVPISAKAEVLIAETLKRRSQQGKLPLDYLDLYDRFVTDGADV